MVRMRGDARTREYVARRTGKCLSKKEIFRCLKRYIVRELYPLIQADLKDAAQLLIRPCEVLSCITNATILKLAHHPLRVLLEHGHMVVGRLT